LRKQSSDDELQFEPRSDEIAFHEDDGVSSHGESALEDELLRSDLHEFSASSV
jgi:hypothetical protein